MTTMEQILSAIRRLFVWWVVIAPWEQAIRVRLGKNTKKLGSGVHLTIPGFDEVFVQPIRLRTIDIGVQTVTTSDDHAATIAGNVQFKVGDILKFYNSVHDPEATTIDLAASEIAKFVTSHTRSECKPHEVMKAVNASLDLSKFGFEDARINITDFAFVRTYRLIQDSRVFREGYINMRPKKDH